MSEKIDSAEPKPSMLLPVSGTLVPPTGDGSLLNIGAQGEERLAQDLTEQLGRVGDEARKLALHAAAIAAEKAPEIRRKTAQASAIVGDLADKAVREAGASVQAAGVILADPEKRRAAFARNRRRFGLGFAVAAVIVGGGWMLAKHEASATAKDRIESLITRYNLRDVVSYSDVSASPFGSATLSGVTLNISGGRSVRIASLGVSGVRTDGDRITGLTVAAKSIELPLLNIVRQGPRNPTTLGAIGMGYRTLVGDADFSVQTDERLGTLSLQTAGEARDAGSWDISFELSGVDIAALSSLYSPAQIANLNSPLLGYATEYLGILTGLGGISVNQARMILDDSGYFARSQEITDAELPPDDAQSHHRQSVDETEMVRAGITPEEANKIAEAVEHWNQHGGTLRFETNLDHPLPLFRNRNIFEPVFANPEQFFAAAKGMVSN